MTERERSTMGRLTISQRHASPAGTVAESAYTAWPQDIRRLLEPARTVRPDKPRYAVEPRRAEVA